MDTNIQIESACAQLIHTENRIKDASAQNEIGSVVAQLIHTGNQIRKLHKK